MVASPEGRPFSFCRMSVDTILNDMSCYRPHNTEVCMRKWLQRKRRTLLVLCILSILYVLTVTAIVIMIVDLQWHRALAFIAPITNLYGLLLLFGLGVLCNVLSEELFLEIVDGIFFFRVINTHK